MEELRVCPSCGYERGFHVSFRRVKKKVNIRLICPNCGQSYDIGWEASSVKSIKADKGAAY
jgi:transcription elongation factor Elf1